MMTPHHNAAKVKNFALLHRIESHMNTVGPRGNIDIGHEIDKEPKSPSNKWLMFLLNEGHTINQGTCFEILGFMPKKPDPNLKQTIFGSNTMKRSNTIWKTKDRLTFHLCWIVKQPPNRTKQ